MEERIITFNGEVNEGSALTAIMQLLYFDSESKTEPIQMYLNSNGGNIIHGLAIYDTIKYISAPVYITCTGLAASMGAFLLSCGEKGHRADEDRRDRVVEALDRVERTVRARFTAVGKRLYTAARDGGKRRFGHRKICRGEQQKKYAYPGG